MLVLIQQAVAGVENEGEPDVVVVGVIGWVGGSVASQAWLGRWGSAQWQASRRGGHGDGDVGSAGARSSLWAWAAGEGGVLGGVGAAVVIGPGHVGGVRVGDRGPAWPGFSLAVDGVAREVSDRPAARNAGHLPVGLFLEGSWTGSGCGVRLGGVAGGGGGLPAAWCSIVGGLRVA